MTHREITPTPIAPRPARSSAGTGAPPAAAATPCPNHGRGGQVEQGRGLGRQEDRRMRSGRVITPPLPKIRSRLFNMTNQPYPPTPYPRRRGTNYGRR